MNGACGQFLASARRTSDHDATIGWCHALYCLTELVDSQRSTDQIHTVATALTQVGNFTLELGCLQSAFRNQNKTVGLEWFLDKIIRTATDRGHRCFNITVTGNHNNGQLRMLLLDLVKQCKPIKTAAL